MCLCLSAFLSCDCLPVFVCVSVCLSVCKCLFVRPVRKCLFVSLVLFKLVYHEVSYWLSLYLLIFACLVFCLSAFLFVCLSVLLYVSAYLCLFLSVNQSVTSSDCLFIIVVSLCLSVYLELSVGNLVYFVHFVSTFYFRNF